MEAFLSQVAKRYFEQGGIENKCFIFPNRRSINFFGKYVSELVAENCGRAMMVPQMLTINDFFYRVSGFVETGRVTLLLELYKCYQKLYSAAEPLDEFIFWGDILLADFNDVDKYLADPKSLFMNVVDFKDLSDDLSHLNDEQREAVELFLDHFRNFKAAEAKEGNVKKNFMSLWEVLYPLYTTFNQTLAQQGLSYEGMAYRSLAQQVKDTPVVELLADKFDCDAFVFVGLNALNECEKLVMNKMQKAGIAQFCWDYCSEMIHDRHNKSSLFMSQNVEDFPSAFKIDYDRNFLPEIHVVSVPSAVGQVKVIPQIFKEIADSRAGGDLSRVGKLTTEGTDCAVVLPDESLLPYVLNSIPPEIQDINVTMGYPMTGSECYVMLMDLIQAQMQMLKKGEEVYFYHKPVRNLFFNAVLRNSFSPEDLQVVGRIKDGLKYYIPLSDFQDSPLLARIFRPVLTDANQPDAQQIQRLEGYLLEMIGLVAPALKEKGTLVQELDYAMMCYTCLQDLRRQQLSILPKTYKLLLSRILSGQDVHFKGEPLKGLQIMGPLETRALDFTNMVILSCNEEMFPRKSITSSFIPAELRKGFGLPTYEYQDAVWAYYFYRMIQRTENLWLVVDSRSSKMNTGEESRYIKQLEYHFGVPLKRSVVQSSHLSDGTEYEEELKKPENIKELIQSMNLSASSLQNYLRCPAMFYYSKVCGLSEDEEVVENIDSRILGNVFHATMQALYLGGIAMDPAFSMERKDIDQAISSGALVPLKEISIDYVRKCLSEEYAPVIKAKVRAEIIRELNTVELKGRNLVIEDVIIRYVHETLRHDLNLMVKKQVDHFTILGLEQKLSWELDGFKIYGYLDRLDAFGEEDIRVIDYKTGLVQKEEQEISEKNYKKTVKDLFNPEFRQRKRMIALQLYFYDQFVLHQPKFSGRHHVINSLYAVSELFKNGIVESPMLENFNQEMEIQVKAMFEEMTDPAIPFRRTQVEETCKYCEFKSICGK